MKSDLYSRIDDWFDSHKKEMFRDLKRLVAIPSVSDNDSEIKPFGQECRDVLDEALTIAAEHGFDVQNYEYYLGSAGCGHGNMKNTIGLWNHLDVVPMGNDWTGDPCKVREKDGFLIGRGVGDNKGPAVGMLYMMECIRELSIPMKHELRLFLGCNEEKKMADIEYYTAHYETPLISVIADSGFPVCYGEKGILEGKLVSEACFSAAVAELYGGQASNMIPDRAYAVIRNSCEAERAAENLDKSGSLSAEYTEKGIMFTASGTGRHSAFPYGSINAIHELAAYMMHADFLDAQDRQIFASIEKASEEYLGDNLNIAFEDEVSGKTTCAATVLRMKDKKAELTLNIRYSVSADSKKMNDQLLKSAETVNMEWVCEQDSGPNYFPREHPAVSLLTDFFNEQTGLEREAFVMGGGTYARKLPGAFAYGLGGMELTEEETEIKEQLFRPGHGGAHEPDEALCIRTYMDAVKLFTKAMLKLDECEL